MVLEWIRRHDRTFEIKLREYLFTEGSIVGREKALEQTDNARTNGNSPVSLGSLRGEVDDGLSPPLRRAPVRSSLAHARRGGGESRRHPRGRAACATFRQAARLGSTSLPGWAPRRPVAVLRYGHGLRSRRGAPARGPCGLQSAVVGHRGLRAWGAGPRHGRRRRGRARSWPWRRIASHSTATRLAPGS